NFFTRIAERWGLFICMDSNTSSYSSLAVARVLVLTSYTKAINGTLPVRLRLDEFLIRVCEESSRVIPAYDRMREDFPMMDLEEVQGYIAQLWKGGEDLGSSE
ncbi:hypothetical protein Ancab_015035, partial [Ancistrocladus abbreviatus]